MNGNTNFPYKPHESEAESASNSYLMSLVTVIAGLPLPIINLLGTVIFYFGNKKGTYFERWHCTQALLNQIALFITNAIGFSWSLSILFSDNQLSNQYIGYMIVIVGVNIIEFITNIYTAIQTRKGIHVEWIFFGSLTDLICKE